MSNKRTDRGAIRGEKLLKIENVESATFDMFWVKQALSDCLSQDELVTLAIDLLESVYSWRGMLPVLRYLKSIHGEMHFMAREKGGCQGTRCRLTFGLVASNVAFEKKRWARELSEKKSGKR